jgi:hypothetical protein
VLVNARIKCYVFHVSFCLVLHILFFPTSLIIPILFVSYHHYVPDSFVLYVIHIELLLSRFLTAVHPHCPQSCRCSPVPPSPVPPTSASHTRSLHHKHGCRGWTVSSVPDKVRTWDSPQESLCLLSASSWLLLAWLTLQLWRWRQYIPSKYRHLADHRTSSQETVHFTVPLSEAPSSLCLQFSP